MGSCQKIPFLFSHLIAYFLIYIAADERKRMIQEAGGKDSQKAKMGFADMARSVSKRWKLVSEDDKAHYLRLAAIDKQRYYREMNEWYRLNNEDSPEGEESSSPEKSENEDDRKPSPQVDHDKKDKEDPSTAGLKAAPQEHTQGEAMQQAPLHHPSTGLGVAASMQDLGLAQQRLQNDVYASAISQQANLLSLPGDSSNVNSSSHNAGFASALPGTFPQQEHLHQFLEQQASRNQHAAGSTSSPSNPSRAVAAPVAPAGQQMTGGLGSAHSDLAYLQLLQKLHQMQQQQSGYAVPSILQTHQAYAVPPSAYAAGSPAGLLNTSFKPIHDEPHDSTSTTSQGQGPPTRTSPLLAQQGNESSPPGQESKTDRIAAAANYLSSVAAASVPQAAEQEPADDPRGSIRQHLNAMISMGTDKQLQQQRQQQQQQNPRAHPEDGHQEDDKPQARPRQQYQSLASNLGDDALSFFVNTF